MDILSELRVKNLKRQEEWCAGGELSISYLGNELAGEAGELCNVLKKLDREKLGMVGSRSNVAELSDEIGDVLICLDSIAARFGIDLGASATAKFNKTSNKYGLNTKMED